MEKPWMPGLLDTLQAPPPKQPPSGPTPEHAHEEPVHEQHAQATEDVHISERTASPALSSDDSALRSNTFADIFNNPIGQPARPTLGYAGDTPWEESLSDRLVSKAPAITIVVLLVAGLAVLSFFYRVQVGHSLVRLGEKVSGEPAQQAAIATPVPQASASPAQAAPPPVDSAPAQQSVASSNSPAAKADNGAGSTADMSASADATASSNASEKASSAAPASSLAQPAEVKSSSQVSAAPADGQAEFRVAQAALAQASTPQEKAKAAELLWAAVSKGSSDAEVELADVYASGAGVGRNCQQARILLNAATDKQNPLAAGESAKLRGYGCR